MDVIAESRNRIAAAAVGRATAWDTLAALERALPADLPGAWTLATARGWPMLIVRLARGDELLPWAAALRGAGARFAKGVISEAGAVRVWALGPVPITLQVPAAAPVTLSDVWADAIEALEFGDDR